MYDLLVYVLILDCALELIKLIKQPLLEFLYTGIDIGIGSGRRF